MNAPIRTKYFLSDDEAAAMAEHVDSRVRELMAPGAAFDPLEPSNFDEAISEVLAQFPSTNLSRTLAVALREGGNINKVLADMAHAYWEPKAEAQAEADLVTA